MSDETKITPAVDDFAAIARRMRELQGPKAPAQAPKTPIPKPLVYNNIDDDFEPRQLTPNRKSPTKIGRF